MSAETPPAFLQAGVYGAEQTRRTVASLLTRGGTVGSVVGGLVQPTDCALTPPGSGMSVNVAPGEVWVPGTSSTSQSGYYCRVSSSTNLAIAAADPTNPRIDTIIAQVQDAAYTGSINSFQVAVVTGTPTSGATLVNLSGKGTVPASSLVLGYVLVPANATSVVAGDILGVATPVTLGPVFNAGSSNIATSQSTTSSTYTTLTTPDEVSNVVLPTDGLLAVWYQATWQESVSGAARAAIFLGSNQSHAAGNHSLSGTNYTMAAATSGGAASTPFALTTFPGGLITGASTGDSYSGDVTTGQAVGFVGAPFAAALAGAELNGSAVNLDGTSDWQYWGGPCYLFAAAGTYTVSIQFKVSSGNVQASNRKLWVQALSL